MTHKIIAGRLRYESIRAKLLTMYRNTPKSRKKEAGKKSSEKWLNVNLLHCPRSEHANKFIEQPDTRKERREESCSPVEVEDQPAQIHGHPARVENEQPTWANPKSRRAQRTCIETKLRGSVKYIYISIWIYVVKTIIKILLYEIFWCQADKHRWLMSQTW